MSYPADLQQQVKSAKDNAVRAIIENRDCGILGKHYPSVFHEVEALLELPEVKYYFVYRSISCLADADKRG